ncbi:Sister chromatid cohesion protein pds5 [Elasticomyces elasticus]|nr:Sister chromatid cohesion protein pds5 [Elasticomyces elasticus]
MPRARKRAASPEEVAVEEHHSDEVMEDPANALQFDEPLTWKAGKPIAVADLLRRMKALYDELQATDQGDAHRETLVPKAQELANVQLLAHKDKGVKAWTLLCIVEMFRLLAPDAPYKGGQLKQIFELFVSIVIPALASPSDPYNQQHLLILTSLTTVKSIILLTDIPGSDTLILNLFTNCFDVMSGNAKASHGEQLGKNVEFHMTGMLSTLVDECQELPGGVVEIILAQFLRADPLTLSMGNKKTGAQPASSMIREVSPAYNMARSVCNSCADKMSRVVSHYFSTVMVDAADTFSTTKTAKGRSRKRTHDESEDESDDGLLTPPAEEDWGEVEKAHRLLRELWRSSPDVISGIIPQLEAEVNAENAQLRIMAVQTVGDMVAGIGAAGPPSRPDMDPAAYPSQSLDIMTRTQQTRQYDNPLLAPAAPHAFSSVYPATHRAFVERRRDKNAQVRSALAAGAGLIVETAGGGKGLDADQEAEILRFMSDMLNDSDERVRLAAVQAVARFDFATIVQKVAKNGGAESSGSVLYALCDRAIDRKLNVRTAAMHLLGRIWGVAAGAIAEGSEHMRKTLGPIATRILDAMYVNDPDITALVQQVLFDSLLPISYPPIKSKAANGESQRVADSQGDGSEPDPDAIRAERILVLVRDLSEKAKKVFFAMQQQQASKAKYMEQYLKAAEAMQSGDDEDEEDGKSAKKELDTMIAAFAKMMPDAATTTDHLNKFAKARDRRAFQLIRFCYSPDSDYRKVVKAMKELTKRFEESTTGMLPVLETLVPLVRSLSVLVNNRSHVPAIMTVSQTDQNGLGTTAHEVLKEISSNTPEVFRVHMRELCDTLRKQAPTAVTPNHSNAVIDLKTVAGFAVRFPKDVPQDREFYQAMTAYAKHGTPPAAAKHAVTIVAAAEKREMYIKEIVDYALTDFDFGAECFLPRLAALSQLRLVANQETEEYADDIMDIASKILGTPRTLRDDVIREESYVPKGWKAEEDQDLQSKLWALKILVNGLRGLKTSADQREALQQISVAAQPVYLLLNTIVKQNGEIKNATPTARHHHPHLRLAAANQLLKLSCNKLIDTQLRPGDFNNLASVAQAVLPDVRGGFFKTLQKYLGQSRLPTRFYALVFLYAFEPNKDTKAATTTWIQARAALLAKSTDLAMENVFSRLLSLCAHHEDFYRESKEGLVDTVEYVMYYLKTVATEKNLPLIYHIAQRIKSVADGIDPAKSEDLYCVSDLAEAVIRCYQDIRGWSLQLYSGQRFRLPAGIFKPLDGHQLAQEIAEKSFLPDKFGEDEIEELVKLSLKPKTSKKRKSEGKEGKASKKVRLAEKQANGGAEEEKEEGVVKKKKSAVRKAAPKTPKVAKTPKRKSSNEVAERSSVMRKSNRQSGANKSYAEQDDSEDDEEMEEWDRQSEEDEKEMSSTPTTSDPTPAPVTAPVKEVEPEQEDAEMRDAEEESEGVVEKVKAKAKAKAKPKPQQRRIAKEVGDEVEDEEMKDADEEPEELPQKGKAKGKAKSVPKKSVAKNVEDDEDEEMEEEEEEEEEQVPRKIKAKARPKQKENVAKQAVAKGKGKASMSKAPARTTRATKSKEDPEKSIMDFPSDSDELSDAPSDMDA